MATPIKTNPCMTPEEFMLTFEYRHLTPKMQEWISTYLQGFIDTGTFNVLAATQAAYATKNSESARVLGYQITGNPKIVLALNRFFGVTQKDLFLKQLERAIYNRKITVAQVRALELAAQANGWTSGFPRHQDLRVKPPKSGKASKVTPVESIPIFPPAEPKYKVGTIANDPDDGKPYILLGVSADGNEVTEARPLTPNEDGTFFDGVAKGTSPTEAHVPAGATPLVDSKGAVKGYRTADEKFVQLVEAL